MELSATQQDSLGAYLRDFDSLIGDPRTGVTFPEIVKGILGAGSLVCQRIASWPAILSRAQNGAQRVIRLVTGQSTNRSRLSAADLTAQLRQHGVTLLSAAPADELGLILDGSDLRKPYAQEMPDLMWARDLNGQLGPGYRTLNVVGLTPHQRAILYHR